MDGRVTGVVSFSQPPSSQNSFEIAESQRPLRQPRLKFRGCDQPSLVSKGAHRLRDIAVARTYLPGLQGYPVGNVVLECLPFTREQSNEYQVGHVM